MRLLFSFDSGYLILRWGPPWRPYHRLHWWKIWNRLTVRPHIIPFNNFQLGKQWFFMKITVLVTKNLSQIPIWPNPVLFCRALDQYKNQKKTWKTSGKSPGSSTSSSPNPIYLSTTATQTNFTIGKASKLFPSPTCSTIKMAALKDPKGPFLWTR